MSLVLQKVKRLHLAAFWGEVREGGWKRGSDRRSAPASAEYCPDEHGDENEEQEFRNHDPAPDCENKKNEQKQQQHLFLLGALVLDGLRALEPRLSQVVEA